jgi:hypothetical protein
MHKQLHGWQALCTELSAPNENPRARLTPSRALATYSQPQPNQTHRIGWPHPSKHSARSARSTGPSGPAPPCNVPQLLQVLAQWRHQLKLPRHLHPQQLPSTERQMLPRMHGAAPCAAPAAATTHIASDFLAEMCVSGSAVHSGHVAD